MISVIIPSFNAADTLKRAVDSCLLQNEVAEIIVVDDASTDSASVQLADDLAAQHSKVNSLRLLINSGPAAARNFGILNSTQPILAFLDADDEYLDNAFEIGYSALMQSQKVAAIKLPCEFVNCPTKYIEHPTYAATCQTLINTFAGNLMVRREVMFAMGLFPQDPIFRQHGSEDGVLMVVLRDLFLVGHVEQATPSLKIHFHKNSHSQLCFEMAIEQFEQPGLEQKHDDVWYASIRYIEQIKQNISNLSSAYVGAEKGFVPVWKP